MLSSERLERSQAVVQVEPGRFYTAETLKAVLDRLKQAMPESREYTPAELREALGTSRKFLIPLRMMGSCMSWTTTWPSARP